MISKIDRDLILQNAIAKAVKYTREEKKRLHNKHYYTHRAIADRINITPSTISQIENANSDLRINTLRRLVEEGLEENFKEFWEEVIEFYKKGLEKYKEDLK